MFCLCWGEDAIEGLKNLEFHHKEPLHIASFRKLQQILDPAQMGDVLKVMRRDRPSLAEVNNTIGKVARKQWYTWHVYHPENNVHEERSMHLPTGTSGIAAA